MQINIGRLRGGFCVYWDEDGKRRRYKLEARTRAEAESEGRDRYLKETKPKGGATVSALWASYIDSLGERPTAKTMGYTGQAVLPHFGGLRPDQITDDDCRAYLGKRLASGRKVGAVHTELGHLRSCMNWAAKRRLIDRAPYIERPNKPTPREVFLTRPEMARLVSSATAPHATVAITLLAGTAARVGAIMDLTWDRVDFERSQINLRLPDAVTRKGRAVVPMNGMVRATLQTAHEAAMSEFVVEHGGARVKSIRTAFNAAKARAGLEGVTIHDVRRSAARFMVEAGVPMDKVAQMLGHSNTAMTEKVYGRFSPDHLHDAADVLDFTRIRRIK